LDVEKALVANIRNTCEVIQVHLLASRWQFAHESTTTVHQVGTVSVVVSFDDEKLLLPTEERVDRLGISRNANGLQ
jgi:hypothetical protein